MRAVANAERREDIGDPLDFFPLALVLLRKRRPCQQQGGNDEHCGVFGASHIRCLTSHRRTVVKHDLALKELGLSGREIMTEAHNDDHG